MAVLSFHMPRTALNIILSVIVLLVLIVGGGIAYIWYTGQGTQSITALPAASVAPTPAPTPTKPSPNATLGASVQMLSTPSAPGQNVAMTVKTLPTAKCTISVVYNEVPSTDSGLVEKTADEFGMVNWTWTIGDSVPLGTWPVNVTCAYNGRTAVVRGDLVVAR